MKNVLVILFVAIFFWSCDTVPKATVQFKVQLLAGTTPLNLNGTHTNPAGNVYSTQHIEMILSQIELEGTSGWTKIGDFMYYNPENPSTLSAEIPAGHYTALRFRFGVCPCQNANVPNTLDYRNMEWPQQLGGGFHYMKWEGTFQNNGSTDAFAVHLGPTNGTDFSIQKTLISHKDYVMDSTTDLTLKIDLHQFLQSPNAIDFKTLPAGIMDNSAIQTQIQQNAQDAFSL